MKTRTVLAVIILATVAALVFSSVSFAQVKIENGIVSFPERAHRENGTTVNLNELRFSFPPDTPKEMLVLKGKIFKGDMRNSFSPRSLTSTGYIIPLGYNSNTKKIGMHCVWEKGMSGRPVQVMISGLFDPEGSTLSPSSSSTTFKLSFKKEKFDLVQNNGNIGFFESVAEFPIPEPAPTVPKKEPTVISDVPISECQWLVGLWVGVIEQEKETRSLEISLSKEDMKATYGVTGNKTKTGYTKLEISGDNIHFETGSKSKVNLHKVSDSQLEGTFETSAGRITKAKFIKY